MEPVTSAAIQQFIQRLAERYGGADIDRKEFRAYFEEIRRRVTPGRSAGKR